MSLPLLYDKIRARISGDAPHSETRRDFGQAVPYEITSALPLFSDWNREKGRDVPRLPPHTNCWAEWRWTDSRGETGTHGVWFYEVAESARRAGRPFDPQGARYCYECILFSGFRDRLWLEPDGLCLPFDGAGMLDDGLSAHVEGGVADLGYDTAFGIPCLRPESRLKPEVGGLVHYQLWPALMCFSLLHCRNIVEEVHEPSTLGQKVRKREGKPRLMSYRTLKIEVPRAPRKGERAGTLGGDGPKVRLHLCSGHFRELRSERFTNKRGQLVWVPAHLKGSEELGAVTGPRVLHAAGTPA